MLWKVAWRNTWRNRKRSFIIAGAVTTGLACGIFLMAFYNGMLRQRIETAVAEEVSHLQFHHPSFRSDYEPRFVIPRGGDVLKSVLSDPGVRLATGRVVIRGMITSPTGSAGVQINGIQPGPEAGVTGLREKLSDGKYFSENGANEILIGKKLLDKLKLKIRLKVVLTFQDSSGTISSAAFRITGVYRSVNAPYEENHVFVNIRDLDSLAAIPGQYHEVAVLLKDPGELESTLTRFRQLHPLLDVQGWKEIAPELALTVTVGEQMVYIFMGIILLALAFGIVNTMLMAVLERTRELGMLIALGMNRRKIFGMIVLETFFLVLAGTPVGIGIALGMVALTGRTGISLRQFEDVYASFGYGSVTYPSLETSQLINILLLVLLTAFLSALVPAWRALRLHPAGSIRK